MEVKVKIPESLAEISVGQYQEWRDMIDQTDWTPIREKMITVSILCRLSIDVVESMSINDLNSIYKQLSEVLADAFKGGLKQIIEVDGVEYGFHPDLANMTTGEWIDLEEELTEHGDVFKAIPQLLAILYRPIIPKKWYKISRGYDIEPYTVKHIENADKMKEVDMETASGMAVFFWTLGLQSSESFMRSIQESSDLTMNPTE